MTMKKEIEKKTPAVNNERFCECESGGVCPQTLLCWFSSV